jgi:hypothetical protein
MGRFINRLLRKHNVGKLALGQFLIFFAFLILDPAVVHDASYYNLYSEPWDPGSILINPQDSTPLSFDSDEPWIGTISSENVTWVTIQDNRTPVRVPIAWDSDDTPILYINMTQTFVAGPNPLVKREPGHRYVNPWCNIGSVDLEPGKYQIWVYEPSTDDGIVDYRVFNEGNTRNKVTKVEDEVVRRFIRTDFHLNSDFVIEEEGRYDLRAQVDSFKESRTMLVVPVRPLSFYMSVWIGIALIGIVVATKSYGVVRWIFRTETDGDTGDQGLLRFPADVAYFFSMGLEPNWKGGAFFRFPRGTARFFEWEPLTMKFPKGTAEFFDLPLGPP